jgi:hypothetical protein
VAWSRRPEVRIRVLVCGEALPPEAASPPVSTTGTLARSGACARRSRRGSMSHGSRRESERRRHRRAWPSHGSGRRRRRYHVGPDPNRRPAVLVRRTVDEVVEQRLLLRVVDKMIRNGARLDLIAARRCESSCRRRRSTRRGRAKSDGARDPHCGRRRSARRSGPRHRSPERRERHPRPESARPAVASPGRHPRSQSARSASPGRHPRPESARSASPGRHPRPVPWSPGPWSRERSRSACRRPCDRRSTPAGTRRKRSASPCASVQPPEPSARVRPPCQSAAGPSLPASRNQS